MTKYVLLFLCQKKLLCQTNNKSKYVEIYQLDLPTQSTHRRAHGHSRLTGHRELYAMNTLLRALLIIGGALALIA